MGNAVFCDFSGLTLVSLAALLWVERSSLESSRRLPLRAVCKTLASVGFVAAGGVAARATPADPIALAMLIGLSLSLLGDLFLLSSSRRAFLFGLFSFFVAHGAYAFAFYQRRPSPKITALAFCALLLLDVGISRWLLPHVPKKMRVPVISYIAIISIMVALAAGVASEHGSIGLVGAAIAFYLSDLSVARDRFVAPGFVNKAWGLPLYYFAQLFFAWSVSRPA